jgi:CBS domain-containing protein
MPKNTIIEEIMVRDVACATLPGSRDEVLKILKNKRISGVPVLKDNKVVGLITRTNLLRKPEEEQLALLMARDPQTIAPDANITDAARLFLENRIRRLPVVEGDKLVGLVTIADVIGSMADLRLFQTAISSVQVSSRIRWRCLICLRVRMMMHGHGNP